MSAGADTRDREVRADSLEQLRELMGDCRRCGLAEGRTRLVFGVGDPDARLMFIGEAPGRNEDLEGEPFVGAAGKLLDELLAGIGLTREQVYIANILKSRPPGNRDPLAEEIDACTPYLREQIRLVDPDVIATLGNYATRFMLGTDRGITSLRGHLFRRDGRLIVPIFHPAVGLYDPRKRPVLTEDFQRLRVVLDRVAAGEIDPRGPEGDDGAPAASAAHDGLAVPEGDRHEGSSQPAAPQGRGSLEPEQATLDLEGA